MVSPMPSLTLYSGCTLTLEAINSTTGAAVTGVTVTLGTIFAANETTDAAPTGPPPTYEDPLPLFVPIPEDESG